MSNPNPNTQNAPDQHNEASTLVISAANPNNGHNNNRNQQATHEIPRRRSSRYRYPSSCCLCFRIHQGFINIVYLDTARFFWGIIFGAMVFSRSDSIIIDYVSAAVNIAAILLQSYLAIISVRKALPINNYIIFKRYFLSKIFYIATAFFDNIIKNIIICKANLRPSTNSDCTTNSLGGQIVMNVFWLIVESYFAFIVYVFYVKTKRGDYGSVGSRPNYGDQLSNFSGSQPSILEAIEVEVQGLHIKTAQSVQVEKDLEQIKRSVPLSQEQLLGPKSMTIYKSKTKHESNEVVMVDLTVESPGEIVIVTGKPIQADGVIDIEIEKEKS